jgi:hypothetical protein
MKIILDVIIYVIIMGIFAMTIGFGSVLISLIMWDFKYIKMTDEMSDYFVAKFWNKSINEDIK